jgi:hypothetical protein
MSSLNLKTTKALRVTVSEDSLVVDLSDGRTVSVPIAWYPRLLHGSAAERKNWRLIAGGEGIHWPDLDEDLSVESMVLGHKSGESQASLRRWIASRDRGAGRHRLPQLRTSRQSTGAGRHSATHR